MRLIDAEAFKAYMRGALEQTRRCYPDGGEWAEAVTEEFCRDIDAQPTVEPERKRGEWKRSTDNGYSMYECSVCESRMWKTEYDKAVGTHGFKFCPYCGADMRGGDSDE